MLTPALDHGDVVVYAGDCIEVMAAMPAESVDAVVCDPPYGLEFMGREWDRFDSASPDECDYCRGDEEVYTPNAGWSPCPVCEDGGPTAGGYTERARWNRNDGKGGYKNRPNFYVAGRGFQTFAYLFGREALRVLKPGGHLIAFGGTRTFHRLTCGLEDAGFEIRDTLSWLYGQGFPKSLDVSKAIDRRGDEAFVERRRDLVLRVTTWIREARDRAGVTNRDIDHALGTSGMAGHYTSSASQPHVPTAEAWPVLLELLRVESPPAEVREAVEAWLEVKGQPAPSWSLREITGQHARPAPAQDWKARYGHAADLSPKERRDTPATADAARWQGWGTALKPAWEPAVLARKPLAGTVAGNVLAHGTGGINVDGCRIGNDTMPRKASDGVVRSGNRAMAGGNTGRIPAGTTEGRWPANVLLDEDAARILDEQAGERPGMTRGILHRGATTGTSIGGHGRYGVAASMDAEAGYGDTGGPSRFYYTAKASTAERGEGNTHPTVKPVDLMRWLVRLVTPPGGTVLDPFLGSGTTAVAARREGFRCVGIERDPEYLEIIRRRLNDEPPTLFGLAS